MIRAALYEDIPAVAAMGRKFHEQAGSVEAGEFDRSIVYDVLKGLIDSAGSSLLVYVDGDKVTGMVGGVTYPCYVSGRMLGQELFWWTDSPGSGLELLERFEQDMKERGAEALIMIAMDTLTPDRVGKIYERRGYRPFEHSYIKEL